MRKKLVLGALVALPLLTVAAQETIQPVPDQTDLAAFQPKDTLLYIEAPGLPELLGSGLDHPFIKRLLTSEFGQAVLEESEASPEELLRYVEDQFGIPVLPTLASLFDDGVGLGVYLRAGKPAWTLTARGDDAVRWREVLDIVLREVAADAGHEGALDEPTFSRDGVDVWLIGDELAIALSGRTFVAAPSREMLRRSFARVNRQKDCLSDNPRFDAFEPSNTSSELIRAWVDVERVETLANAGGDGEGLARIRALASQPEVHLLLGSELAALSQGDAMLATLHVTDRALELEVAGVGIDTGEFSQILPSVSEEPYDIGPMPIARTDDIVRGVVYRDFASLFARRTDLFPAEVAPRFAQFADQVALFFGGLDVETEVLPHLSPWLRVLVREVDEREGIEPEIELPGLAVLADVDSADKLGPYLMSAFQSAISLTSVDRAQRGLPPFLLSMELHEGVAISSARFLPPMSGEPIDARFNLEPAAALVGSTFVIGTHVDIVRQVVTDLALGNVTRHSTDPGWLSLRGPALAQVGRSNFDALAMNSVLEDGKTMERARHDIEMLLRIVRMIDDVTLRARRPAVDRVSFELSFSLGSTKEAR